MSIDQWVRKEGMERNGREGFVGPKNLAHTKEIRLLSLSATHPSHQFVQPHRKENNRIKIQDEERNKQDET
jgi:hypothetical protein